MEYSGATGQILRWYAYGLGPNDALGQVDVPANSRATFIPDMLGSVIGVVDGQGALTKIGYAPYGASSAAIAAPLRFTGQRRDAETGGLHYYRARMYAPAWGRFMQVDPIGYQGGVNLYAYVGNDPLNLVDPEGFVAEGFSAGFSAGFLGNDTSFFGVLDSGSTEARIGAAAGFVTGVASQFALEVAGGVALVAGGGVALRSALGIGATRGVGGAGPVRIGQIGEELAGVAGPKVRIPSATGTARFRVPDELTPTTLREVKNMQRLQTGGRAGDQLRDFSAFGAQTGRQCVLCVRQGTQISPQSQQFLDDLGFIVERKLP